MTVHNAAYRTLGLNFLYKAFAVDDLRGALAGVRALGIRGCSVSMPFKEIAVSFVDELDSAAVSIGAINTIVNDSGRLIGYNTDAYGAQVVLARLDLPRASRVLLLGAGGAARAILYALKSLGYSNITVANRSLTRIAAWPNSPDYSFLPWAERHAFVPDIIINSTSVGMTPSTHDIPIGEESVARTRAVFDVVVTPPETRLIQLARAQGKLAICGYEMSLHQAVRQFELYTGHAAPVAKMEECMKQLVGNHQRDPRWDSIR